MMNWTLFSVWLILTSSSLALLLFGNLEARRTRKVAKDKRKESSHNLTDFAEEVGGLEVDAEEVREEFSDMYVKIPVNYVERNVVDRKLSTTSILRQNSQRPDSETTAAEAILEVIMGGREHQEILESALNLWDNSSQPDEDNLVQKKLRERKRKKGVIYNRATSGSVNAEGGQLEVIYEL